MPVIELVNIDSAAKTTKDIAETVDMDMIIKLRASLEHVTEDVLMNETDTDTQ